MTEQTATKHIALVPLLIGLVLGASLAACARSAYESHDEHAGHDRPRATATADSDAGHATHAAETGGAESAGHDEHAGHDMDSPSDPVSGPAAGATKTVDAPRAADTGGHAERQPTPAAAPAAIVVDLGNTNCPTMGGEVNGKTFTVWSNLRVGHCCPGCSKAFLATPETMLDEVAPGWRDAQAAVVRVNAASGADRARLLAELGKTYTVVGAASGE